MLAQPWPPGFLQNWLGASWQLRHSPMGRKSGLSGPYPRSRVVHRRGPCSGMVWPLQVVWGWPLHPITRVGPVPSLPLQPALGAWTGLNATCGALLSSNIHQVMTQPGVEWIKLSVSRV